MQKQLLCSLRHNEDTRTIAPLPWLSRIIDSLYLPNPNSRSLTHKLLPMKRSFNPRTGWKPQRISINQDCLQEGLSPGLEATFANHHRLLLVTQILPLTTESTEPGMFRACGQPLFLCPGRKNQLCAAGRGPGASGAARRGARPARGSAGAGAQRLPRRRPGAAGSVRLLRGGDAPGAALEVGAPAAVWPPRWRCDDSTQPWFLIPESKPQTTSPFAPCGISCAELGTMTHPIWGVLGCRRAV